MNYSGLTMKEKKREWAREIGCERGKKMRDERGLRGREIDEGGKLGVRGREG